MLDILNNQRNIRLTRSSQRKQLAKERIAKSAARKGRYIEHEDITERVKKYEQDVDITVKNL